MFEAALSLGVEGGEQRGDPTASTFVGAFLYPSFGDVMEAAVAVEVHATDGFASSGGGMFSLHEECINKSGRSSCN